MCCCVVWLLVAACLLCCASTSGTVDNTRAVATGMVGNEAAVVLQWNVTGVQSSSLSFQPYLSSRISCGLASDVVTWEVTTLSQFTLFEVQTTVNQLVDCQFSAESASASNAAHSIFGLMLLDVVDASTNEILREFVSQVAVQVNTSAHSFTSEITVYNVVVVDSVQAYVGFPSFISLWKTAAFLQPLQIADHEFHPGDTVFVMHTVETTLFHVVVGRVWFSASDDPTSSTTDFQQIPPNTVSTLASINVGEVAISFTIPHLRFCKICYLHIQSTLVPLSSSAKSLTASPTEQTTTSTALLVTEYATSPAASLMPTFWLTSLSFFIFWHVH